MTGTQGRVTFTCVQNAGRSQVATTFAERERNRRERDDIDETEQEVTTNV